MRAEQKRPEDNTLLDTCRQRFCSLLLFSQDCFLVRRARDACQNLRQTKLSFDLRKHSQRRMSAAHKFNYVYAESFFMLKQGY